jgi:hypothetical protein
VGKTEDGKVTIEVRDKRFGVIAVEKGFISKDQLYEAIKIQIDEDLLSMPHRLIGRILIRLGYLTDAQAQEILVDMRKR